jgi:hypothetical protein
MRLLFLGVLASALLAAGCDSDSSPTPPTKTPAAPSVTETFEGTVRVGSYAFYSFQVSQYGTINLTLNTLRVGGELSDAAMALTIGQPSAQDCFSAVTQTAGAGFTPQVTGSFEAGVYCVKIADPVPLPSPGVFNITIAHP